MEEGAVWLENVLVDVVGEMAGKDVVQHEVEEAVEIESAEHTSMQQH